jgi:3-oxoadipate enol-lactonase
LDGAHDQIETALLRLGVQEAAFVGFSGGAYRALALATRGRIKPLGLVSLAGTAHFTSVDREAFDGFAGMLRRGEDARALLPDRFLSSAFAATHPEVVARVERWLDAIAPEHLATELDAFARAEDLRPALGSLRVSALARVGELDVATPPERSAEIAEAAPGAVLQVVPKVGHALLYEDAEATALATASAFPG